MISWYEPRFGKKEKELVNEVLESGYVSEGPKTKELEEKLSKIVGAKYVVMTTSGTSALYLAIKADMIIKKYEKGRVIVPAMTFLSTRNAAILAGLEPVLTDINKNGLINYKKESIKPRIIIPVNLLGRACDISQYKDSTIICDNAGSLGSKVPNGTVGCYSLQANKLISSSQGGFCATNDERYANIIRQLKDMNRKNKTDQEAVGFNFKFDDIKAAIALGQLEQIESRKINLLNQYKMYKVGLSKYGDFMNYKEGEIPLWIEFKTNQRDELIGYLKAKGIMCRKPWKELAPLPNTLDYVNNVVWLPSGPHLSQGDIEKIIEEVKSFYEN